MHRIADRDAQGCREILAEHDAGNAVTPGGERVEAARLHGLLHVGNAWLEDRIDAEGKPLG